jgi:hypothetical protein
MTKARNPNAKKSDVKKKKSPAAHARDGNNDGNNSAQNSEYRDLRKRIGARKDAKEILKIAKLIENNP